MNPGVPKQTTRDGSCGSFHLSFPEDFDHSIRTSRERLGPVDQRSQPASEDLDPEATKRGGTCLQWDLVALLLLSVGSWYSCRKAKESFCQA